MLWSTRHTRLNKFPIQSRIADGHSVIITLHYKSEMKSSKPFFRRVCLVVQFEIRVTEDKGWYANVWNPATKIGRYLIVRIRKITTTPEKGDSSLESQFLSQRHGKYEVLCSRPYGDSWVCENVRLNFCGGLQCSSNTMIRNKLFGLEVIEITLPLRRPANADIKGLDSYSEWLIEINCRKSDLKSREGV